MDRSLERFHNRSLVQLRNHSLERLRNHSLELGCNNHGRTNQRLQSTERMQLRWPTEREYELTFWCLQKLNLHGLGSVSSVGRTSDPDNRWFCLGRTDR